MSGSEQQDSADDVRRRPENFWTVGTTPMTQQEAEEAARLIAERFEQVNAFAVDPRSSMTLSFDRWTAEMVREALVRLAAAGGEVGNMLEDFDEFLVCAHPYDTDEDRWPGVP